MVRPASLKSQRPLQHRLRRSLPDHTRAARHRGDGRAHVDQLGDVVAADDCDIVRNMQPEVAGCPKRGDSHERIGDDRSGFAAAVEAARAGEVAVVVVAGKSGLHRPVTVGEGNDATSLELTGIQVELVEALAATGTPLVVIVLSGRCIRWSGSPPARAP